MRLKGPNGQNGGRGKFRERVSASSWSLHRAGQGDMFFWRCGVGYGAVVSWHGLAHVLAARACFPRNNNRLGKHGRVSIHARHAYSAKLAPISLHAIHHLRLDVVPFRIRPTTSSLARHCSLLAAPSSTTPLASAPTHVAVPRRMSRGPNRIWGSILNRIG